MVSVAAEHAFSAPRRLVEYIWCLFIEPNAFLRRCERMDRRARCWVFRYCFTLYRDHQSNAFLYSLSRSIILCCPLLLSSCDKRDHILNLDRLHLHLDFNPYLTLRLAPLAPVRWTRTSSHSKHTESQASISTGILFVFLGIFLFIVVLVFFFGLDTSAILKYPSLSIITALAPPGCSRAASRKHAVLLEKTDGQADGDHDVFVYGDCIVWL